MSIIHNGGNENPILYTSAENPNFVIREEPCRRPSLPAQGGDMVSYIYHDHHVCDKCVSGGDCDGWVSAWDVRLGQCFHCGTEVPKDITTVWTLHNAEILGGFMFEESRQGTMKDRLV
jgi:hypothetical protein